MTLAPALARASLALEVTTRCAWRCAHCYNPGPEDAAAPREELPAAELVGLTRAALQASGRRRVQVTGGEPLQRDDLLSILRGLRQGGAQLSLATSGDGLDTPLARELARLGVGPVQLSLLAARRELHDRLKGPGSFDSTLGAIGHLRRQGLPVSVAFVCRQDNAGEFAGVLELCHALGVPAIAFNRLCLAGGRSVHSAALSASPAQLRGCLDLAEWAVVRLGLRVQVAITLPHCLVDTARTPHLRFGGCSLASDVPGYTLDPAGNLRACSISSTVLGNLGQESWDAIVARARREYFPARTALSAACRACAQRARCRGGCRETAWSLHRAPGGDDPLASPAHRLPLTPAGD